MGGFAYVAPSSVDEAVAVLAEHAGQGLKAQIIAGGTDLLVQMRSLDKAARTIVDVKKIGETGRLEVGAEETFIGAGICCAALHESDELKALFPGSSNPLT